MAEADIGLIGLAVMGENLVLNMANHGFTVAVYNRTTSKVDDFVAGRAAGKSIVGSHSPEELCKKLKRPRRIMIMVKAGAAVDKVMPAIEFDIALALVRPHQQQAIFRVGARFAQHIRLRFDFARVFRCAGAERCRDQRGEEEGGPAAHDCSSG